MNEIATIRLSPKHLRICSSDACGEVVQSRLLPQYSFGPPAADRQIEMGQPIPRRNRSTCGPTSSSSSFRRLYPSSPDRPENPVS